ncbi:efflux RND transporter periplasmic adaptor subunit, partial [Chloroflexota bacterium]
VAEVNVEEGDKVTEGQVLARLNTTSLELVLKKAEIDLEIATDNYRKLTYPYDFRTWALDVPSATARITGAQGELKDALEVMRELGLNREQYSWEQYWDVFNSLQRAQDDLVKARESLVRGYGQDVFESGILPMSDRWTLRAAELQMEKASLALDMAMDEMGKSVMVAPFDGVVAVVDVKEKDNLSSIDYSTRTILELIDPTIMELEAEVDEIDIPGVKQGQKAIISIDALPGAEFVGKVTSISSLSTEESGVILYKVKIGFDVPEGSELKSGMSATVDVIINERNDVLLVPSRVVGQDSSGNPVVKVKVDEQIEERQVVIGISDGYETEIVSGLSEGDIVVLEKKAKTESSGGLFGQ